jgi:hypothetical protein
LAEDWEEGKVVSMIKRVTIKYRNTAVWARGSVYDATPNVPYADGSVIFNRHYEKGVPTTRIWSEIRAVMFDYFFFVFYGSVMWKTPITYKPDRAGEGWRSVVNPDNRRAFISEGLARKMDDSPDAYVWNRDMKKWHMTKNEYVKRTLMGGGDIQIGVGANISDSLNDFHYLDMLQQYSDRGELEDKIVRMFLFVYPDRYDAVIRLMVELEIEFH